MKLDTLKSNKIDSLFNDSIDSIRIKDPIKTELTGNIFGIPESIARILIPVIVTLIVFILGHLISWLKGKMEKKREIDSYKNLILKWIELMEISVEA